MERDRGNLRIRKPSFFPLNYEDGNLRSAVRCQTSESESSRFYASNSSFAKRCFAFDGRREAELSIILFSGKLITCPPTLKSKFSSKSRMSFSSTLLVTPSFRLTSSGQ